MSFSAGSHQSPSLSSSSAADARGRCLSWEALWCVGAMQRRCRFGAKELAHHERSATSTRIVQPCKVHGEPALNQVTPQSVTVQPPLVVVAKSVAVTLLEMHKSLF